MLAVSGKKDKNILIQSEIKVNYNKNKKTVYAQIGKQF